MRALRWGLAGTGFWAAETHAPALAAHPAVHFAGVWGRRPEATEALAARFGVGAYADFDRLVQDVDAVAFAVPPDVQPRLATLAAEAGRHLLLDKPISLSVEEADRLVRGVDATGVASLVFLTARFVPSIDSWLEKVQTDGGWDLLLGSWLGSAMSSPASPYRDSRWRQQWGALWDLGPHALSVAIPALGPIERVSAYGGRRDLTQLSLTHSGGATSALTLSITMPPAVEHMRTELLGRAGLSTMPAVDVPPRDSYLVALDRLHDAIADGRAHPCDVHLGRDIVAVLETAQAQLAAGP